MQLAAFGSILRYLPFLLAGVKVTSVVSLASMVFGSLVGLLVGLSRLSRNRTILAMASVYVDFFRTIPLLILLVWIYYALPIIIGKSLPAEQAGTLGLSLYSASFLAEIIRAGIASIPRGQTEAALSLGMNGRQAMSRIILPQAIVRMLPPLTNSFVTLIKDSSIASIISVTELTHQAQSLATFTLRPTETLTVAAFMYLGMTYPLSLVVGVLHRRLRVA